MMEIQFQPNRTRRLYGDELTQTFILESLPEIICAIIIVQDSVRELRDFDRV